jgi:hypothetical protein
MSFSKNPAMLYTPVPTEEKPLKELRGLITMANMSKMNSGLMPTQESSPIVVTDDDAKIIGELSAEEGRIFREYLTVSQYLSFICDLDPKTLSADDKLQNIPWDKKINDLDKDEKQEWDAFLVTRSKIESSDVKKAILEFDTQEFLKASSKSQHRLSCRQQ